MENFINILEIVGDLKELQKKVYLDSPEVFVDFADKIDNNQLDEMVLFFATKYDYLSIVKFIVNNNLVNLDGPSKNTQFKTIKEHILEASNQFASKDINEFLSNFDKENIEKDDLSSIEEGLETFIKSFGDKLTDLCNQIDGLCNEEDTKSQDSENIEINEDEKTENIKIEEAVEDSDTTVKEDSDDKDIEEVSSGYEPKFICPNCNCNILEEGYSVLEKVNYKYSKEEKKIVKLSSTQIKSVTCNKCNYTIEQLDPLFLENISTVQNCKKCGKDLTSSGITAKLHSEYDKDSNCFVTSKKTYHCGECSHELSEYQISYFSLD